MKFLAKFSVGQPVLMNLLVAFMLIAGYMALTRLPREVFPEVPQGKIVISAFYPGVSPQEMESLVAIKIEREIKDIRGIDEISTMSTEGLVAITVSTDDGLGEDEVSRIALDIQAAIGRISDFPPEMDKPVVKALKIEIPVVYLGIQSSLPEMETRALAKELQEKIENLKGVSSVQFYGMRDLEIRVEVDPDKAAGHNVTLARVMAIIKSHQSDIPGGTIKLNKGEYLIRVMGKVDRVSELRKLIVSSTKSGIVRIEDIATIEMRMEDPVMIGRVGGKRSIYMAVTKKITGDAINISDRLKVFMGNWEKNAPDGVHLQNLFDSAKYIKRRQETMYSNGLMGLILVLVLLFIFLSWRAAVLTALGIPVAFFGTFVIMWYLGISLSMMSMFGLIVALGMIVDDAIVVVENVYRHIMEGLTPTEAAIKGAQEVTWPIIGSVTTTVVAFSTLSMMPGNMGKILATIPVVVAIALSISLFEALLVLPSHLAEWMQKPKKFHKGKDGKSSAEARWFVAFQNGFVSVLRLATRFWPVSLLIFVGFLFYSLYFAGTQLEFNPFPSKTIRSITINMETQAGAKLEHTENVLKLVESQIQKTKLSEVESFWCTVGSIRKGHSSVQGSHYVNCTVNFANDGYTSPRKPPEMIAKWREYLGNLPDLDDFSLSVRRGGPPSGFPIDVQVRGPEQTKCAAIAGKIREFAMAINGVTDVNDDVTSGKRELRVVIDQERASVFGLDSGTVGMMVRRAFAGGIASKIQKGDDDINIIVRYPEGRRSSIDEIRNLKLISPITGKWIQFRSIGKIVEGRGPGRLMRVDQKRAVTVVGEIDATITNSAIVNKKLIEFTDQLEGENPGYSFVYGGESKASGDIMASIKMALLLSLFGIYIILATILQSLLQPLIVLVAIPFGAIGVIAGHWFHDLPLSMTSSMGIVALLGVVVNDSLVMVDFINKAIADGMSVKKAVIEGGRLRLRPVILTTVTTVVGLLPMGLGIFGSEEFLEPMALSIVWGLGFATAMTLFLVPCTYLLIDGAKRAFIWPIKRIFGSKEVSQ
jgi:multidrug efflux pump subunit AcrB